MDPKLSKAIESQECSWRGLRQRSLNLYGARDRTEQRLRTLQKELAQVEQLSRKISGEEYPLRLDIEEFAAKLQKLIPNRHFLWTTPAWLSGLKRRTIILQEPMQTELGWAVYDGDGGSRARRFYHTVPDGDDASGFRWVQMRWDNYEDCELFMKSFPFSAVIAVIRNEQIALQL